MKLKLVNLSPFEPKPMRWTKRKYYEMYEMGWFRNQRVELIEGEVIARPPIGDEHAFAVRLADAALRKAFGAKYTMSIQSPLDFGESQPEPDVAVLLGTPRDFKTHPRSAVIVVEVADTTLFHNQVRKAPLCAANKVAEYWIVNLPERPLAFPRKKIKVADLLP